MDYSRSAFLSAAPDTAFKVVCGIGLAVAPPREREVLDQFVAGKLNKQIGGDLGTVEKTIRVHRAHLTRRPIVGSDLVDPMRRILPTAYAIGALTACTFMPGVSTARAQDIEPRAFSNAPIGVNFLIAGYANTRGGLAFDASLPVKDPNLKTSSAVLAYVRTLDLWGKSGKFDAIVPYTWLSGTALFAGETIQREVDGLADSKFRLSVNLYGAPALTLKEFVDYQQDLIVGVSLQVSVPSGQYDPSRLVNIGTNRWSFKPEVGVSKAMGPWTLEFAAAATVYTDNTDFLGGNTRAQDPVYSMRGHAIYGFRSGIWASLDATYLTGGRTTLNGAQSNDLQQNWRVGGTLSFPVDARNSIKLYASSGVSARTGNNFDLIGIAWQYRWGGGL